MVPYHFSAGEVWLVVTLWLLKTLWFSYLMGICITRVNMEVSGCCFLFTLYIYAVLEHLFIELSFYERVGRVCRLWNSAASSPALWRSVSIGYCWIEPGKRQLPGTEQKIKNTVDWLTQNRLVITVFSLKPSLHTVQSMPK